MEHNPSLPEPVQTSATKRALRSKPGTAPGIIDFLTMGVASALCLVLGGGIGVAIDVGVHSTPLWTFVGLGFGVAAAVAVTVAQVRKNLHE